ncbi:DoxX family protein [Brevibacillus fulvus]|uniref:Membrane protein YphA (DoxX/SURF4 family) n=1 Tax=Brevibacillus fulvus TaxID=1125967 RepID=A0A938Y3Q2_9BACL|nr:DoxX family protein [Brevibacillus fulvus]MBM7591396.1 putative membrane protein YphA (DoxX/SURF4 family) [Brevibacillus fulvus]
MNRKQDVGILILRLAVGLTFFIHGLIKFQSGLGNIGGFFESVGLPSFLAYIVAIIETFGGLAVVLGLATRFVAVLFSIVMIGAIITVKLPGGFTGNGQGAGYELDLLLLAGSICLVLTGANGLSLDRVFFQTSDAESISD